MLEPRAMAGHQTVVNGARGNQEGSGQDSTGEAENRTLSDSRHGWFRLAQAGCRRQWLLPGHSQTGSWS